MHPRFPAAGRFLDALHSIRRDLAHAVRSLIKERTFTLVCVVSLGIGMGALVALATFGRAVTAPARGINTDGLTELLVLPQGPLRAKAGVWALERWSYPDYQALRDAETGMAHHRVDPGLQPSSARRLRTRRRRLRAWRRSTSRPTTSSTFGVSLARGSGFDPAIDDTPSAEPRVVLSHDFWRSRMASDPDIVGKSVTIDGVPHTVVGITPDDFRGHFHFFQAPGSMLFIPLERHPRLRANPNLRDDRTVDWVRIHGRLNAGVDLTRANALVSATVAGLAQRYPATNEFKAATVEPYYLAGCGRPSGVAARAQRDARPGGSGAPDRVPEHLGHDAGPRRQPRARAVASARRSARTGGASSSICSSKRCCWRLRRGAISAFVLFGIPAIVGW